MSSFRFARSWLNKTSGRCWLQLPILLLGLTTTGCGQRGIATPSLTAADLALRSSLEAWKLGATVDDQRSLSPPVYVSEELWQDGARLLAYQITSVGELYGPNVRFRVDLNCSQGKGRARTQTVSYLVSTAPAITIARLE